MWCFDADFRSRMMAALRLVIIARIDLSGDDSAGKDAKEYR